MQIIGVRFGSVMPDVDCGYWLIVHLVLWLHIIVIIINAKIIVNLSRKIAAWMLYKIVTFCIGS